MREGMESNNGLSGQRKPKEADKAFRSLITERGHQESKTESQSGLSGKSQPELTKLKTVGRV